MKMHVLQILKHKGYNIYIRHFQHVFEYLVVLDNQIYSHYFEIKPQWFRRIFAEPYTENQISGSIQVAMGAAKQTIDLLLKKKRKKK